MSVTACRFCRRSRICLRILLALGLFVPGAGLAADWPQFLGPARNGTSAETGLLASWPDKGPPLVWEKEVGPGYSGPVISSNWLILFHRAGDNEVVEGHDASTGAGRWKFPYPCAYADDFGKGDGPRSTPVVAGKQVFTLGAAGQLHCLELETGKKLWGRSLMEDHQVPKNFFGVGTSPLLEGNLLLVNVGGKEAGVVAFDRDTGKEIWKATSDGASYSSPVAGTIDGARHVFFLTRAGLVSLDPATGTVRFTKPWRARFAASVNAATPLILDDTVFISASYNTGAALLRVHKDGADEIWKGDDILSNHYDTSIAHDGFLYGFDGRQEQGASLRCVEVQTGKVRWTRAKFGCGSMVLADGRLFVLSEEGDLVLLEPTPQEYREKARAHVLTRSCRAQIALAHGCLFARDEQKLICLNLKK